MCVLKSATRSLNMGVFPSIIVPQLPVWLPKLAVVNHWRGAGAHLSEVRILMPDRQQAADNISF
jgi:hypothetical protein